MRGAFRVAAVAVVAAALVVVPSGAVGSSGLESGLWFFEKGNVQAAHDAGFTGEGVTVAVIDSQINPDVPSLRGVDLVTTGDAYCVDEEGVVVPSVSTDYGLADHATSVASVLVGSGAASSNGPGVRGVAPGARVLHYAVPVMLDDDTSTWKCRDPEGVGPEEEGLSRAISDAVDGGADIISISMGGHSHSSYRAIAKALAAGVVVVSSLPNDTGVADWPASANGVVAVQAFDQAGEIQKGTPMEGLADPTPNLSDDVTVAAPGVDVLVAGSAGSWDEAVLRSGTSLATPITAGFLAVVKQKYPDATGNQLIQTLIHNTGPNGEHDPRWGSDMGYGAVSLTSMLQVDPGKYPDVNPLLEEGDDPRLSPTVEEVEQARKRLELEASPSSPPPGTPAAQPSSDAEASWVPLAIGGGVVGVLLLAGIIVFIVLRSRATRSGQDAEG